MEIPTEAIERLKSDAQQQRDGGCVRQADDLAALLGYVAAIEANAGEVEAEQSRWQQAIYKLVCETTGSDAIDGAGCDSGDPLDLSLAEISQGMAHFANHAYDLENELVEYLALEVAGESIPTEDGEWEELRGAFASHAIKAADRLVALNRWERHPTKPGLYRPKPDHIAHADKKVGEVADGR